MPDFNTDSSRTEKPTGAFGLIGVEPVPSDGMFIFSKSFLTGTPRRDSVGSPFPRDIDGQVTRPFLDPRVREELPPRMKDQLQEGHELVQSLLPEERDGKQVVRLMPQVVQSREDQPHL